MSSVKRFSKPITSRLRRFFPSLVLALIGASLLAIVAVATGATAWFWTPVVPMVGATTATQVVFVTAFVALLVLGVCAQLYRRHRSALHQNWSDLSATWRAVLTGGVVASIVAVGLGVGVLVAAVPPNRIVAGFVVAWPAAIIAKLVLDSRRSEERSSSMVTSILVSTGFAQTVRLHSRPFSLSVGGLTGVLSGLGLFVLTDLWFPAVAFVAALVAVVVGHVTWWYYETFKDERTDLAVVDRTVRESRETLELAIRNEASESVDLAGCTLVDTRRETYGLDLDVRLWPGETTTLKIPTSFALEDNDDVWEGPFGVEIPRGEERPLLFARTGQPFRLQDDDGVLEATDDRSDESAAVETGAPVQD